MKNVAYIYQYNKLVNGHSIFDQRLNTALSAISGSNFTSLSFDKATGTFKEAIQLHEIDNPNTIIIFSHFETFRIAAKFKRAKIIFINHDLPYHAYLLQNKLSGLLKAMYSWAYIHYYWRLANFMFFISKAELKKSGAPATASAYISVGIRPVVNTPVFIGLLPVALFTGNYKWSLKARALQKAFKKGYHGKLKLTAFNVDDKFRNIVSASGINMVYTGEALQVGSIKIGVLTDDFLSGFKLKALELVREGCALASFADIRDEFEGVIHADLFIYTIKSLDELDGIYNSLQQQPGVVNKFGLFYAEICRKFNWDKTAMEIKNTLLNF
jgi:hypothetical protein